MRPSSPLIPAIWQPKVGWMRVAPRNPRAARAEARHDVFVLQSVAPAPGIPAGDDILEYKPAANQSVEPRWPSCGPAAACQ